jgi:hypothetical protein
VLLIEKKLAIRSWEFTPSAVIGSLAQSRPASSQPSRRGKKHESQRSEPAWG